MSRNDEIRLSEVTDASEVDAQLEAALELEQVLGRCRDLVAEIESGLRSAAMLAEGVVSDVE